MCLHPDICLSSEIIHGSLVSSVGILSRKPLVLGRIDVCYISLVIYEYLVYQLDNN